MNCSEVQERLSGYLEQSIDEGTAASVESHLSSCAGCRAEARHLADSIQLVSALPSVEPPGNFAQSVMARIRKAEARPNWWEWFFFPLTIKVPVHATALVLVAVLAAYLYRSERPAEPEPPAAQRTLNLDDKKQESATYERESLTSPDPQRKGRPDHETTPQGTPPPPAESREAAPESFALRAPAAGSAMEESSPSYELVIRLRVSPEQDPALNDKLDSLRKRAQDEVSARRSEPKSLARDLFSGARTDEPQTIWIDILHSEYDQFKKDLSSLGTIESESRPTAGTKPQTETADRLRIKLTLLPALKPEAAPPQ